MTERFCHERGDRGSAVSGTNFAANISPGRFGTFFMEIHPASPTEPDVGTRDFYVDCMRALDDARIPYVVGGGYAMAYYTGIARNTKDLDVFLKPEDRDRALNTLAARGYRTEFFYPFWIAKAIEPKTEAFIDILYSSGNGICKVDDDW